MSVTSLSESTQNYLKAVWSLREWSDEPVTTSTLAARVGVRLSSASDAIRKLSEQGLLEHEPYGSVTLTAKGRAYAVEMVRRHRLVETFLVNVLGYRWDQVHDEAEVLEHSISDFMVERLDEYLGYPDHDPHGDPIPAADGSIRAREGVVLTDLGVGKRAEVKRISDSDPELLQYLADQGVGVGSVIETLPAPPFSEAVELKVKGSKSSLSLGRNAAQAVWVKPLS